MEEGVRLVHTSTAVSWGWSRSVFPKSVGIKMSLLTL